MEKKKGTHIDVLLFDKIELVYIFQHCVLMHNTIYFPFSAVLCVVREITFSLFKKKVLRQSVQNRVQVSSSEWNKNAVNAWNRIYLYRFQNVKIVEFTVHTQL